jgi:TrmH family RNA methyltransferase
MQNEQEMITSRQNPLVQLTASLADRKHREKEGLFRFDGKKLLLEALQKGLPLVAILYRASSAEALMGAVAGMKLPAGCRTAVLSDALFDRISEEKSPDGVICLSKRLDKFHKIITINKRCALENELDEGHTLVLESVRDPGNLGTIIRSAAAFGVANVVLSADCADIYHPRTIRAAMGALFTKKLLIVEDVPCAMQALAKRGRVFAAALDAGALRAGEVRFGKNDAVVIGNEGHGLSPAALAAATDKLFIPMEAGVESLNAGIAASVLLWELYHGR